MVHWGISINHAGSGSAADILPLLPEGADFAEIDGMQLAFAADIQEKLTDRNRFIAVRELMPGNFIRRIRETGGPMLAEFRESFRKQLAAAGDMEARWVSADFGVNTVICRDRESVEAVREQLACFYGNLWETGMRLLLDVRWPWGGLSGAEWNRNVSCALANLPFPHLGIAVNAHVHEAGAQECFNDLLEFLKAWKLHNILVRFHYEPELGNTLSGRIVTPVHEILAASGGDTALCACPLLKDLTLLESEAGMFIKLLRRS